MIMGDYVDGGITQFSPFLFSPRTSSSTRARCICSGATTSAEQLFAFMLSSEIDINDLVVYFIELSQHLDSLNTTLNVAHIINSLVTESLRIPEKAEEIPYDNLFDFIKFNNECENCELQEMLLVLSLIIDYDERI